MDMAEDSSGDLEAPPQVQRTMDTTQSFPEPIVVETVYTEDEPELELIVDKEEEERQAKERELERTVTLVVYAILGFFAGLVALTVILVLVLTKSFIVMLILGLLVTIVGSIAYFVQDTMRRDADWKPVRDQIDGLAKAATHAIMEELRNFKLELNEHLLLTDGKEYDSGDFDYDASERQHDTTTTHTTTSGDYVPAPEGSASGTAPNNTKKSKTKRKGGKSLLFSVVKPFLKIRPRMRRRNKKKDQQETPYVPPIV